MAPRIYFSAQRAGFHRASKGIVMPEPLTLREIKARPVILKLKRPVVVRIATISEWPLILIDLITEEGIVGRSYLEPYIVKSMRYLVPAIHDLGELLRGRNVAPVELFEAARKSLHFVGYEGLSMIAASGLDMAAWDALAKAANKPLCVLLGGTVGAVKSYNSNGLWLKEPAAVAAEAMELREEGGFSALKLRLGRSDPRDDLATLDAVRRAVGDSVHLMIDYNQGLNLAEAIERCHMIDDHGLDWIEEPVVYDNLDGYAQLAAELKTPIQIGENFYGPREMHKAIGKKACDLVMPDFMRIGGVTGWMRAAAIAGAAGIPISTHLYPEVAAHVMRATETAHWLEWQDWADPILERPYEVKHGLLHIPDAPGLGLEWNEGAVAAHLASL
ncbi:enolase C-terminal domain-like protein [Bradyrhizobium sp. CB3481]|uniref:enolase C-terminal domain-like protein n=1 Tax=Bradyrhizobium sp. CB3481 TaxID=3039158 RepID=UPI0024B08565|nr:enolase C-terminal domain-like protein [Bradyrhizobium sp. CB3481]WFU17377.1 enolase C-terminal domain-like protein [Bradyrhizobium sp. CB3481]